MKRRGKSQRLKAGVCALAILWAASMAVPRLQAQTDAVRDPGEDTDTGHVAKIQNQDSAFSLVLEAYRQFQSYIIQHDYEAQLAAARQLPDRFARWEAIALAKKERQLRVNRLGTRLLELSATYGYARRQEEQADGVNAPSAVDPADASEKLHDFVVIAPDPQSGNAARSIPVTTLLGGRHAAPETSR